MEKSQIIKKLDVKFQREISSEEDVIYILSRIRKILEIENIKSSYDILNFYCNFALHSRIDHVPPKIKNMFVKMKNDGLNQKNGYTGLIIEFEDFHKDLKRFMKEKELSNCLYEKEGEVEKFNELLTAIYSDTPVTIILEKYLAIIDYMGGVTVTKSE